MPEYLFEKKVQNSKRVNWKNIFVAATCIALVCGIIYGVVCYLYEFIAEKGHCTNEEENVCLTENCLKASTRILSSIDQNEDPCQDFYQFTCGNFIAKAYENNYASHYHLQKNKNKNMINSIIAAPITGDEVGIHLQQKKFYQSCMDVEAIDANGLEPFENLMEVLGGWPIVKGQDWRDKDFNLSHFIISCKNLGLPFQWFFQVYFDDDMVNIGMPKRTKIDPDSFTESTYLNLMIETATTFGAINNAFALRELKKVIMFGKKLKAISEEQQNIMTVITLEELHKTFVVIDWFYLFNNISANYTLSPQDAVGVIQNDYLMNLNLLIARTPKRVLANFLIWKIFEEFGYYISSPVRDNFINFANLFPNGEEPIKARFEFCIQEAIKRFPRVAETEFIQRSINQEKIDDVKDMISKIKDQYINAVNTADWLDEETKTIGIDKLNNIVEVIGDQYLHIDGNLIVNLTDFEFTTDNIIDMIQEKNRNSFLQAFEIGNNIRTSTLTNFIYLLIMHIDALYEKETNILFVTPGVLQDEFLALHRPKYLNYGSLGIMIGHEIGHIFDVFGGDHISEGDKKILYDILNSTIFNPTQIQSWPADIVWKNESFENLVNKIDCLSKSNEDASDLMLNEKYADLIGIDKAYEAYVAWAEEFEQEQYLPGLPFSPTQLFWIQLGVTNCYSQLDNGNEDIFGTFGSLRQKISDIVQNSENFARDFECPEGSLTNPIEKCPVTMF